MKIHILPIFCNSYAILRSCIRQGRNCIVYCSLYIKGLEFDSRILNCLWFGTRISFWCVLLQIPDFWRNDQDHLKNRMTGRQHSQLKALFVFLRAEGLNLVCTLFCWLFIIKSTVKGSSVKQNPYYNVWLSWKCNTRIISEDNWGHVGYWMSSVLPDATMGEQSLLAAGLKLLACSQSI